MNEQLQERLLGYLTAAETAIQNGGEVIASELKEVVHEIAVWGFWSNLFNCLCFILFYIFLVLATKYMYKNIWSKADFMSNDTNDIFNCVVTILTSILACIVLMVGLATLPECRDSAMQSVKAYVAPRIYVIEYVNGLAKDIKKDKKD